MCNFFQHIRLSLKNHVEIAFEIIKIFAVGDYRMFDRFDKSGTELPFVQRCESRYVDINGGRVPERAECVLAEAGIDPGLAADRRIGLGHGGRWYLEDRHTSFEHGRGESCNIADRSAAESDNKRIPAEIRLLHCLYYRDRRIYVLRSFAGRAYYESGNFMLPKELLQMARRDSILM